MEMSAPNIAATKLNVYGLDQICDDIVSGKSFRQIAQELEMSVGSLITWVRHPERSARVLESRALSAQLWDEMATQKIEDADTDFQLTQARELAHHYRWRASKIAPKEYGDKQQVDVSGSLTLRDLVKASLPDKE